MTSETNLHMYIGDFLANASVHNPEQCHIVNFTSKIVMVDLSKIGFFLVNFNEQNLIIYVVI